MPCTLKLQAEQAASDAPAVRRSAIFSGRWAGAVSSNPTTRTARSAILPCGPPIGATAAWQSSRDRGKGKGARQALRAMTPMPSFDHLPPCTARTPHTPMRLTTSKPTLEHTDADPTNLETSVPCLGAFSMLGLRRPGVRTNSPIYTQTLTAKSYERCTLNAKC